MKKSIFVILIGMLIFCIFYGIRYLKSPVKMQTAVTETYENVVDTEGYVIKTEEACVANTNGVIYHYLQEGTRVKKNTAVSTVYTGGASEETLAELNNINNKILELESAGNASYTFSASSEENIETIKDNIVKAKNNRDVSKMSDYKTQIKSIITGDVQDLQKDNIDALLAKKNSLEATLQNYKHDVYSQISGIYAKNVDGLEDILKPEVIMDYKMADFEAIPEFSTDDKTYATSGEPFCKVINNHAWYVMTTVKADTAKKIKIGQNVKVRFSKLPGIEAEGTIYKISTEEPETSNNVIIVKFEQYKEGVFSLRKSPIELVLESYEGYRIPVSALRIVDGEKGVMVNSDRGIVFRKCNVIYTDTVNQTVIIKPAFDGTSKSLTENDNIIIGEK